MQRGDRKQANLKQMRKEFSLLGEKPEWILLDKQKAGKLAQEKFCRAWPCGNTLEHTKMVRKC